MASKCPGYATRSTSTQFLRNTKLLTPHLGPIVNQDRLRARVDSLDGVGKIFILCDEQDNPDEFYDDKKNCDQEHKTCCQPGTNAYSWSNIGSAWVRKVSKTN